MTLRKLIATFCCWLATCCFAFGAQNVKTVGGVAIANVKTVGGVAKANVKTIGGVENTGGGGGTSPGTGNLMAWFNMTASGIDSTANAYHFTEPWVGTVTYTGGYAELDGTKYMGNVSALATNFNATAGDWGFACRFNVGSAPANDSQLLDGVRHSIMYHSGGLKGELSLLIPQWGSAPATDTWYVMVVSYDSATTTTSVSVNGETFVTTSNTPTYQGGNIVIGNGFTMKCDWLCYYSKELTLSNAEWLYNAGATRVYADL